MMQQMFRSFVVALMAANAWVSAISTQNHAGAGIHGRSSLPIVRRTSQASPYTHPAMARAMTYLKYGVTLPSDLLNIMPPSSKRAPRRTKGRRNGVLWGTDADYPIPFDVEWYSTVNIGTPPQELQLVIDTGSADLWVLSSETPEWETNGASVYKIMDSQTATQLVNATWDLTYGDGSYAGGDVYNDVVVLGNLSFPAQAVETAGVASAEFTLLATWTSGVLGLASSSINRVTPPQQTFFDNVKESLQAPLFTVDLKHNGPGSCNFGYLDVSAFNEPIYTTDVFNGYGYWMFSTNGYTVGSGNHTLDNLSVVADTGSSLLLVPDAYLQAYYLQVPTATYDFDQGGFVFPCNATATLPPITFDIGGGEITIPGEYMNFQPIDNTGVTCYGGMQSSDNLGVSVFGGVALKAAFVIFNAEDNTMGFATKTLF